jgi:hypothetical protein
MKRTYKYDKQSGSMVEVSKAPLRKNVGFPALECIASGVHPSQANELREVYAQRGERVEVTNDGNPIYTSLRQRRRLLELRGLHDNNCFY